MATKETNRHIALELCLPQGSTGVILTGNTAHYKLGLLDNAANIQLKREDCVCVCGCVCVCVCVYAHMPLVT